MLAATLYFFLAGFALFLLGLSVFMYLEGQKFGDNQFTVKLLPPPPKREAAVIAAEFGLAVAPVRPESAEPAYHRAA